MEWIAKYYDNVYLLTDEELVFKDTVVYVSPEDKTIVVDHRSINNPVEGKPYKIVWCYEPVVRQFYSFYQINLKLKIVRSDKDNTKR